MSKDRFLELLNLYLDNEIQAQETEALFEAMDSNEEFRRIYDEYSRITIACSMLSPVKVEVRTRRNFSQIVYAVGGLAAAFALVGLAVRNLEPIFTNNENTVALVPTVRQMSVDQVLGPEQVQMASFASNWDKTRSSSGFRFNTSLTTPVSDRFENSSWKEGLKLKLDPSDYSMSHELSLVLDESAKVELMSNVLDSSRKESFLNYKYSRKEPVRLSVSGGQEAASSSVMRVDSSSISVSK